MGKGGGRLAGRGRIGLESFEDRSSDRARGRRITEHPEGRGGGVGRADLAFDLVAGADAGAPGDPGDEAVFFDLAVVVVAVAAVVGRDDEQRLAIQTGGGYGVEQGREALVCAPDGFELRVRHPAVQMAEIVRIGEMDELDRGALRDEIARRLVDHLLAEVAGPREL